MVAEVSTLFALAGAIIFIGFFGVLMFLRTKIPDTLILIFLGVLLGPVFTAYFGKELLPREYLIKLSPFFAAVAIMIILFEGGLGLNFDRVVRQLGITSLLTFFGFILSMLTTAIIVYFLLDKDLILALMLGAVLGGISAAIVLALIGGLSCDEETKTILTLESVLSEVLAVIIVISLIQIKITGVGEYGVAFQMLASSFSIAIVLALIFGILWLRVLKSLYGKPYSFMITLAALLILFAGVEVLGGSGAMAALVFGFVLSNRTEITRIFKMKTEFMFDEKIKQFHSEFSFFIRTFFFVYLGFMFTIPTPTDPLFWIFIISAALIFITMLASRYAVAWFVTIIKPDRKKDKILLWTMLPRGLACAVLASMPIAANIEGTERFIDYAFMIIVLTVATATIGTYITERAFKPKPKEKPKKRILHKLFVRKKKSEKHPQKTVEPKQYVCHTCKQPLRYITHYRKWYCDRCKKYF